MNKKKGFTLIELIIVISLLVTLSLIVTLSFNSATKKAKNNLFDAKKSQIEIAAEKWAYSVNLKESSTITVDYLIKSGFLDSENDFGEVINPLDNSSLNCYTITIEINKNNYYSKMNDEKNCDLVEE